MVLPPSRRRAPMAIRNNFLKTLFAVRKGARQDAPLDKRFRCCANCRHYVPPNNQMMLDGPPSSYCKHPQRVGSRYIGDETDVDKIGLFRRPGDGCDDLFEVDGRGIHILSVFIGVLSPKEWQTLRPNRHSHEGGNPELFPGILYKQPSFYKKKDMFDLICQTRMI